MALAVALVPALGSSAWAATYEYVGNPYTTFPFESYPGEYTTEMSLSISITMPLLPPSTTLLSEALGGSGIVPDAFAYDDGRVDVSSSDPGSAILIDELTTNAEGAIVGWHLFVYGGDGQFIAHSNAGYGDIVDLCDAWPCGAGALRDQARAGAGAWMLVPEPGTGVLVLAGLIGLARARRVRRDD